MTTEIVIIEESDKSIIEGTNAEKFDKLIDDKTGENAEIAEAIIDEKIEQFTLKDQKEDDEKWELHSKQLSAVLTPIVETQQNLSTAMGMMLEKLLQLGEQVASMQLPILVAEQNRPNEVGDDQVNQETLETAEEPRITVEPEARIYHSPAALGRSPIPGPQRSPQNEDSDLRPILARHSQGKPMPQYHEQPLDQRHQK